MTSCRSLLALSVFVVVNAAVGTAEEMKRMEPLLGTYVEIVVEGEGINLQAAADRGFDAFRKIDRLLSSFKPESELSRINRNAGVRPVAVSEWTYQCLARSREIGAESRGAFDITCRPLLDAWGFLSRKYRVPTAAQLEAARALVDGRKLELKTEREGKCGPVRRSAYLSGRGMKIDVGGIGKGFAVDKAVEELKAAGVRSGRVRAWGDCAGFGPREWTIPIEPGRTARLRNQAVSTSGDYENFFESGKRHYAHIVDPRTGMPVQGIRSVTVRAASGIDADGWSTALFVDPRLKPAGVEVLFLERK